MVAKGHERITSAFILGNVLDIPPDRQTAEPGKRLGQEMHRLGWRGPVTLWIGGRTAGGFERALAGEREPRDVD